MSDAPYLRDDRIVATTRPAGAPEYRMHAVVRREFHADSSAVKLVVEGPLTVETEYWDSHQVALAIELLRHALPALQRSEDHLESEWREWRGRTRAPESSQ